MANRLTECLLEPTRPRAPATQTRAASQDDNHDPPAHHRKNGTRHLILEPFGVQNHETINNTTTYNSPLSSLQIQRKETNGTDKGSVIYLTRLPGAKYQVSKTLPSSSTVGLNSTTKIMRLTNDWSVGPASTNFQFRRASKQNFPKIKR